MKVSVVMPYRNAESTIARSLRSLLSQTRKPDEIITIDNASTDSSMMIATEIARSSDIPIITMYRDMDLGLAASLTAGSRMATGDVIVTMHADVEILDPWALEMLITPFQCKSVVATTHNADYSLDHWKALPFWPQVLCARLVGRQFTGSDSKFDGFRRTTLQTIGGWNSITFRTAGEDGDILKRLSKAGRIIPTTARIYHAHTYSPAFGWRNLVQKQAQISEAQGALLAIHGMTPGEFARSFFREILVVLLVLTPPVGLPLVAAYSIAYTWNMVVHEWRDYRTWLLPFLNVWLLLVSSYYSIKGYRNRRAVL